MSEDRRLSKTIASLRAGRGYSLQDLANHTGLSKTHIFDIERGASTNPSLSTIEILASALNVSPAYLVGWSSDLPPLHPEALKIAFQVSALIDRDEQG